MDSNYFDNKHFLPQSFFLGQDLNYYNKIIPCGIFDYGITSIEELIKKRIKVIDFANAIGEVLSDKLIKRAVS